MQTDDELQAIRERCDNASSAPWDEIQLARFDDQTIPAMIGQRGRYPIGWFYAATSLAKRNANAIFCAHARTDIPKLLATIDELKTELARMKNGL